MTLMTVTYYVINHNVLLIHFHITYIIIYGYIKILFLHNICLHNLFLHYNLCLQDMKMIAYTAVVATNSGEFMSFLLGVV